MEIICSMLKMMMLISKERKSTRFFNIVIMGRPRQTVLAKSGKVALFKAKKLLKCCPKTHKVATKTSKVATLIYQHFIQILLNIINHCSFWIIGT